jgi:neopullulanase
MNLRITLYTLFLLTVGWVNSKNCAAQLPPQVYHLAPTHWYTGFSDTTLEIIINAENIDLNDLEMANYPGVIFLGKTNSGNRHIAYLSLIISLQAKPGLLEFRAKPTVRRMRYVKPFKFTFELKVRNHRATLPINQTDIIYRLIVDRYCNGAEGNDNKSIRFKPKVDRADPDARHGGDFYGIKDHIDYLKNLGISTVWFNPVQTSDHPELSFTGFSVSDHFKTDPRLGSLEDFQALISELNKKGLKTMMDINPNDLSSTHWLYQNFDTGWFNSWDTLIHPDFTSYSINDPYYSPDERLRSTISWINLNAPDINHNNPHMAKYLDQFYLWWIENTGLSGYCINRVAFFTNEYLDHIINTIRREFPNFEITTDTKTNSVAAQASMVKNNIKGFESNLLESIPDYHVHKVFRELLDPTENLTETISKLYMALSDDILYEKPELNLSFIDNSIALRSFEQAKLNIARWKLTTAILFTLRGIPVLYYGTEILMKSGLEGNLPAATDFPGGWKGDKQNKFTNKGRTVAEDDAFNYIQRLIQFRNANPVLASGNMMQYPVEKGIYVFFRYNQGNAVMVVVNTNETDYEVDFKRFQERLKGFTSYSDIIGKTSGYLSDNLVIPPAQCLILKMY